MARSAMTVGGTTLLMVLGQATVARATDCFIDSQNGDDTKDGLSEATAVKSQTKVPSSCTVAKYKRGSVFNESVKVSSKITTYTNYGPTTDPLPRFEKQRSPNNGGMFSSFTGGVTIDGLYLSGSMSDASMSNLMNGVGVMLGAKSKLLNSEITNCDIGIMLQGEGSLVQGNYIHDLYISVDAAPGVDPNAVGGAEGIFINGSNNEVAYNYFVGCRASAQWTGGSCDGGATEVTVGAGKTVSGVKIHHNFSYQSCGFFEVSSGAGAKGVFADSQFYDNVSIDSGWLMLLQVNNTDLSNIRWDNNTIVQHKGSLNAGMLVTVFTGTSSGVSGGSLAPGVVSMTNNLVVFDGVNALGTAIDANVTQTTNLIINTSKQDPGLKNLQGTAPEDFDLVSGSPAIDQGTPIANITVDYLNRAVPSNGKPDIGAFEYGATPSTAGGAQGFGGVTIASSSPAAGAANPAAGGTVAAKGGASFNIGAGGRAATSSSATIAAPTGGRVGSATTPNAESGGQNSASVPAGGQSGTTIAESSGGSPLNTAETVPGTSTGNGTGLGTSAATTDPNAAAVGGGQGQGTAAPAEPGGCACRMVQRKPSALGLAILGMLTMIRRARNSRRRIS